MILLDKLTRPNSDKSALVYHYDDNLTIDKILYRTKGRENFDAHYAQIMEERKASALKDRKNVLYVALTRAAEGLIVIKKPKNSIFDEIAMIPMELGGLRCLRQAQAKYTSPVPEPVEGQIVISNYGTQEVKNEKEEEEKDHEAILFGTALHYTLEMLSAFDIESLDEAMYALQNKYGQVLTSVQKEEIRRRVHRLIMNDAFQTLLEGAILSKEQSLSFNGELKQIDLLLEYDESYQVIDYKSSKKYHIKHRNQVNFYKKAIANITSKPTSGAIVYLLEEEIEIEILN